MTQENMTQENIAEVKPTRVKPTRMKPTQEQIEASVAYVTSTAGQKYCPVHRLNCHPLCVCFQIKSTPKGSQAYCQHFKIELASRGYDE